MSTAFDVCGPLPTGVTVLEASAGTGKTYTIAALAARYVADGIPLEQLLLVTFTRMATGELRDRVRERLVSAEQGLARVLAGAPPDRAANAAILRPLASSGNSPRLSASSSMRWTECSTASHFCASAEPKRKIAIRIAGAISKVHSIASIG